MAIIISKTTPPITPKIIVLVSCFGFSSTSRCVVIIVVVIADVGADWHSSRRFVKLHSRCNSADIVSLFRKHSAVVGVSMLLFELSRRYTSVQLHSRDSLPSILVATFLARVS